MGGTLNTRQKISAITVLLLVTIGIIMGLKQGPASPSQFYINYSPMAKALLKDFSFTKYLGEYIGNNVGIFMVLFFLGCVFPPVVFDMIIYNFMAITRMALYLGANTTIYVLCLHGIYELASILMVSWCSLSLFILMIQELIHKGKYVADFGLEAKVLAISLGTLIGSAFIEGWVTPLLWR
jgi:uncharacterized membrane protein SpoIIM required for sporulation